MWLSQTGCQTLRPAELTLQRSTPRCQDWTREWVWCCKRWGLLATRRWLHHPLLVNLQNRCSGYSGTIQLWQWHTFSIGQGRKEFDLETQLYFHNTSIAGAIHKTLLNSFLLWRTNLYKPGVNEPLFVWSPHHPQSHGSKIAAQVSLLDIFPTILDWFNIKLPNYHIFKKRGNVKLTGSSLLKYLSQIEEDDRTVSVIKGMWN